jgi:hypothetical protein
MRHPLNGCALSRHGRIATYFVCAIRISFFSTILDRSMKISVGRSPEVLDRDSHSSACRAALASVAAIAIANAILVRIALVSAEPGWVSKEAGSPLENFRGLSRQVCQLSIHWPKTIILISARKASELTHFKHMGRRSYIVIGIGLVAVVLLAGFCER